MLARLARVLPDSAFATDARRALSRSLTNTNIKAEVPYLSADGRATFERPYGLAWLLQLAVELREWDDDEAKRWLVALTPLEAVVAQRIKEWLPNLSHPIRVGEHSQTAFAFGLILDWATVAGDVAMVELVRSRIDTYYRDDQG